MKVVEDYMNSKGYKCSISPWEGKSKSGYRLNILTEGSKKLFEDISVYIPDFMQYKLP